MPWEEDPENSDHGSLARDVTGPLGVLISDSFFMTEFFRGRAGSSLSKCARERKTTENSSQFACFTGRDFEQGNQNLAHEDTWKAHQIYNPRVHRKKIVICDCSLWMVELTLTRQDD